MLRKYVDIRGTNFRDFAGIEPFQIGITIESDTTLVVVSFDGRNDLWLVEKPLGLKNLKAYYESRWPGKPLKFQEFKPIDAVKDITDPRWF